MKRSQLRVLSVLAGIALGTICALTFRMYRMANSPEVGRTPVSEVDENWDDEEDPWDMVHQKEDDPGRRKDLATLVQSAKAQPDWLKEFEFTDQNGNKVSSESLRGQPYVACFFFTTCTGTCPRQTSQMQLLHNKLKDQPIRFVNITVDPKIDTPEVLKEYASKFRADPKRWFFLHGEMDYITNVGQQKFFLDGVKERGHPDRFVLVNAEGDPVGAYHWLDIDERELLNKHIDELLQQAKSN